MNGTATRNLNLELTKLSLLKLVTLVPEVEDFQISTENVDEEIVIIGWCAIGSTCAVMHVTA